MNTDIRRNLREQIKTNAMNANSCLKPEEQKQWNAENATHPFGFGSSIEQMDNDVITAYHITQYMCRIEPGEVRIKGVADEPEVEVEIREPYYLGKHLVTKELWNAVMDRDPSVNNSLVGDACWGDNLPVDSVSYNDAMEFVRRMNEWLKSHAYDGKFKGWEFSLPTEAQWVYAAKGGKGTKYAGSDELTEVAFPRSRYSYFVGMRKPNSLGLYDMNGLLDQWCLDCCCGEKDEDSEACRQGFETAMKESRDSGVPCTQKMIRGHIFEAIWKINKTMQGRVIEGKGTYHILHGGNFEDNEEQCLIDTRKWELPETSSQKIGFRLALVKKA